MSAALTGDKERRVDRPGRRLSLATRDALTGYLLVTPQFLGFCLFVLGPMVAVFVISSIDANLVYGNRGFVGLDHYVQMMSEDMLFRRVMINTAVFTFGLVPINIGAALLLAVLLNRELAGKPLFQGAFFLPVITAAVAWAIVWRFLLQGEQGGLNQMLALVGVQGPNWLREGNWAMAAVIVTRALKTVGLKMVIFLAALRSLPEDVVEAARVDGANEWQLTWRIVLPLISPTILVVMILTVIGAFQAFDHVLLMTNGGPGNATIILVLYVYREAFSAFETGYASALAVVLFLVALVLTVIQWSVRRRWVHGES